VKILNFLDTTTRDNEGWILVDQYHKDITFHFLVTIDYNYYGW
jgi:hypothetical protein